jgi:hypothetical protein
MRIVTIVTATAILGYWAASPHVVSWRADQLVEAEKNAAIELSCAKVDDRLRPDCESELAEEIASGETTPQLILRLHCTRFKNTWEPEVNADRPAACQQYIKAGI